MPGIGVARAAMEGNAPEIALRVTEANLRQSPGDAALLIVQGEALAALDRPDAAEGAFRQALAQDPSSAEARMGLGRLTLARDPAAAERSFLEVLATEPRNARAWNNLGIARDLQGRHADAQEAYRKALGLLPTMQAATDNLVRSMGLSGPGRAPVRPAAP